MRTSTQTITVINGSNSSGVKVRVNRIKERKALFREPGSCTASISKDFKMSTTSKALFRILLELKEAIQRGKSISGLNLLVYVS